MSKGRQSTIPFHQQPRRQPTLRIGNVALPLPEVIKRAIAAYNGRDWDGAEQLCRAVLRVSANYFDALNLLGIIAAQSKRLEEAADMLGRAVAVRPDNVPALSNLGALLQELHRFDEALTQLDRAIAVKPDYAEAYGNRGVALKELKQLEAAVASYDKAISLKPDYAIAYYNRGIALNELKQLEAAVASYDQAISLKPDYAEAYYQRGNTLQELTQLTAAVASYDKAIGIRPDYAELYSARGVALRVLGQLDAALDSCDHAIGIRPGYAEAYNHRGMVLKDLARLNDAVSNYDQAISLKPDYAEAYSNRGIALKELQQWAAAVASYDRAISLKPDLAQAHYNRGNTLAGVKLLSAAVESYDTAIAIDPGYSAAYWNKGIALLLNGDYARGWPLYERGWELKHRGEPRCFSQPLWLGSESIKDKTILLHSEQGLGDTIQFSRYARLVAEMGAKVVMEVQKPLLPLLQGLAGVAGFVEKGKALPAFDFHCPLLSLPLAFKTEVATIPVAKAYLRSNDERVGYWANQLRSGTRPRVGLVWSGSATHKNDHNRSIALQSILPYLPRGVDYVCLQKELRDADKVALAQSSILYFGDAIKDFSDTAALCDLMDVVISVDTSVAHLAGSLGKKTWVLLPYAPDWRWLLNRRDSPWYPGARLYRQEKAGDWAAVFSSVKNDLNSLVVSANLTYENTEMTECVCPG